MHHASSCKAIIETSSNNDKLHEHWTFFKEIRWQWCFFCFNHWIAAFLLHIFNLWLFLILNRHKIRITHLVFDTGIVCTLSKLHSFQTNTTRLMLVLMSDQLTALRPIVCRQAGRARRVMKNARSYEKRRHRLFPSFSLVLFLFSQHQCHKIKQCLTTASLMSLGFSTN